MIHPDRLGTERPATELIPMSDSISALYSMGGGDTTNVDGARAEDKGWNLSGWLRPLFYKSFIGKQSDLASKSLADYNAHQSVAEVLSRDASEQVTPLDRWELRDMVRPSGIGKLFTRAENDIRLIDNVQSVRFFLRALEEKSLGRQGPEQTAKATGLLDAFEVGELQQAYFDKPLLDAASKRFIVPEDRKLLDILQQTRLDLSIARKALGSQEQELERATGTLDEKEKASEICEQQALEVENRFHNTQASMPELQQAKAKANNASNEVDNARRAVERAQQEVDTAYAGWVRAQQTRNAAEETIVTTLQRRIKESLVWAFNQRQPLADFFEELVKAQHLVEQAEDAQIQADGRAATFTEQIGGLVKLKRQSISKGPGPGAGIPYIHEYLRLPFDPDIVDGQVHLPQFEIPNPTDFNAIKAIVTNFLQERKSTRNIIEDLMSRLRQNEARRLYNKDVISQAIKADQEIEDLK
jgi:hypothetical protein